jgi:hypothetical protein
MVVLRDPTMGGQTVDPLHPGPEVREMLTLEKLGFRFGGAVEGLHTRQIWVFEYAGKG